MFRKLLLPVAFSFVFNFAFAQDDQNKFDPSRYWALGIQMWTFNTSSFYTALKKADSCNIKYIEAYPGQLLKDGSSSVFGPSMTPDERKELKEYLKKKHFIITSLGVIVAGSVNEWKAYFDFASDMGIHVMVAEPDKNQLGDVNRLAGTYNIKVALHDHPFPSPYWHPDSAMAAIKNRSNIGVCADIGHWARNGLNVVDCLKKCKDKMFELHFKDVKEFARAQAPDVLLGEGVCDIPSVLAELKRQNFVGLFVIEYEENPDNNVKDIKQYVRYYNDQVKKLK